MRLTPDELETAEQERDEARAEVERLRAALAVFADRANWIVWHRELFWSGEGNPCWRAQESLAGRDWSYERAVKLARLYQCSIEAQEALNPQEHEATEEPCPK
jgi:hypothetical protein